MLVGFKEKLNAPPQAQQSKLFCHYCTQNAIEHLCEAKSMVANAVLSVFIAHCGRRRITSALDWYEAYEYELTKPM